MKSSLDRELAFWGSNTSMIGLTLERGSDPAHGDVKRKDATPRFPPYLCRRFIIRRRTSTNGSNPAHGDSDRKGCSDPKRRGFRPTIWPKAWSLPQSYQFLLAFIST